MLEVTDARTTFTTDRGPLTAVDGVSLSVQRGRTLAIVGESGSGKSVLSRTIMGLTALDPLASTAGSVRLHGEELLGRSRAELRGVWARRISMVFQDPMTSLNPTMRLGRQVGEAIRTVHGRIGRGELRERTIDALASVGLPSPAQRCGQYPHELSGGMRQRVVIAIALAKEPDLLIADEPTTALDVTVQAQVLELLARLQEERGMAMILVTHDLGVAAAYADEIAVMYAGRIVEHAETRRLFEGMRMPYTQALFNSIPKVEDPAHGRLAAIDGSLPDLTSALEGCRFAPRCPRVRADCSTQEPELLGPPVHRYRCRYPLDEPPSAPVPSPTAGGHRWPA